MTPRNIPLLLTLDVHGHPDLHSILLSSAEEFSDAGERVTYFVSADLVRASRSVSQALREIASAGHSIGCHGLDHDVDPFTLTEDTERESLTLATNILEDSLGSKVKCYRAPDFRLTPRTLPILQDLGYEADCSVTSRRLPILSSCPWCFGWIVAPSRPYHPNRSSPFRKGSLQIVEIPTTSFIVPMAHGFIANCHEGLVRHLMAAFIAEARKLESTVLVPMIHPESMLGQDIHWLQGRFSLKEFLPKRNGGVWFRYRLRETDNSIIKSRVHAFLSLLRSQPDIVSMSIHDYLAGQKATAPGSLVNPIPSKQISVA
jgi:Polysaccharide deacetylase